MRKIIYLLSILVVSCLTKAQNLSLQGNNGIDFVGVSSYINIGTNDEPINVLIPTYIPAISSRCNSYLDILNPSALFAGVKDDICDPDVRVEIYEKVLHELFLQPALSNANLTSTKNLYYNLTAYISKTNEVPSYSDLEFMFSDPKLDIAIDLLQQALPDNSKLSNFTSKALEYYVNTMLSNDAALRRCQLFRQRVAYANTNGIYTDPALFTALNNVNADIIKIIKIKELDFETIFNEVADKVSFDAMKGYVKDKIMSELGLSDDSDPLMQKLVCGSAAVFGNSALKAGCKLAFKAAQGVTETRNQQAQLSLLASIDYHIFYLGQSNPKGINDLAIEIENGLITNYGDDDFYLAELRLYFQYLYNQMKMNTMAGKDDAGQVAVKTYINQIVDALIKDNKSREEYQVELRQIAVKIQELYDILHEPHFCYVQVFPDVPFDYWAYPYIDFLASRDIVNGNQDGNYYPENNLTRGELAKMLVNAADLPKITVGDQFDDVGEDNEFFEYVQTLKNMGYVTGIPSTNNYGVYNSITRAEFCKIIAAGFQFNFEPGNTYNFTDVQPDNEFYDYIQALYQREIIIGYGGGVFGPYNNIKRSEASKVIYKSIMVKEKND